MLGKTVKNVKVSELWLQGHTPQMTINVKQTYANASTY